MTISSAEGFKGVVDAALAREAPAARATQPRFFGPDGK